MCFPSSPLPPLPCLRKFCPQFFVKQRSSGCQHTFPFFVLSSGCLPPNKTFCFLFITFIFSGEYMYTIFILVQDKSKVYVLSPTISKIYSQSNCWLLLMQLTNLSGFLFRNERLVQIFRMRKIVDLLFQSRKKYRLLLYFINLSSNSSTLRPL